MIHTAVHLWVAVSVAAVVGAVTYIGLCEIAGAVRRWWNDENEWRAR